jgi:hypothetical protein
MYLHQTFRHSLLQDSVQPSVHSELAELHKVSCWLYKEAYEKSGDTTEEF